MLDEEVSADSSLFITFAVVFGDFCFNYVK